jgi:peptidoglycan/LPS O-acetylase OafA/YrhL
MYYFLVTCIFLLQNEFDSAVRHYLFVQGDGHLWTIMQEMYFYLLLPLLTLSAYVLCRGRPLPTIIFLAALALIWKSVNDVEIFSVYGQNKSMRVYFQVFLLGMIGAYWYHGIYQHSDRLQQLCRRYQWALSLIGFLVLFVILDVSRPQGWFGFHVPIEKRPGIGGAVGLMLILLAVIGSSHCWYKKLLANSALRYVGIIGFSFYLIHPYVIFIITQTIEQLFAVPLVNVSEVWLVLSALVMTTVFASFTYAYIERPFLKKPAVRNRPTS